ncbi:caspase family protein [Ascidiaceihabitans sp.]|nr:caspase family protein [Ascidiaceihabitans sp.]
MQKKLFCVVTFFFVHLCSAVLADTNPFKEKSCGQMFGAEEITKWDKCVGEVEQNDIKWLGLYSKGSLNGLGVIWFDGGKTKFFGHFFDGLPQRGYAVDENSKIALVENYEICEECSFGNVDEIFPYIDAKFWALSTTERTLLQRNLDATGYFPLEIDGDLNKVFEAFAGYAIIEKNIISLEDEYYVDLIFSELLNQPLPSKADYDGGKSPLYNAEDDLTLLLGGEVSVSKIGAWELLKSTNSCAVESMPLFSRQSFRSNNEKDFLGNPLITVHDQALGSKLRISSNSSEDGGDITVDVNKQKNELTTFFNKDTNYKVKDWKIGTLDKNYKENYFSNFKWRETKTSFNLTDYNTDEVSGLFSNNVLIVSSSYIDENSNLLEVRDYYDATSLDEAMAVLHTDHCPNSLDFQTLVWTEFWGTAILIASGKKRESVSLAEHCQENSTAFCVSDQDYVDWDNGTYKGGMRNGYKNGQGTYTNANGEEYIGEWKDDVAQGQEVDALKPQTCEDDPALCSVAQLCQKATLNKDGAKVWSGDVTSTSYVELAKSAGVTCGVIEKPVVVAEAANCSTDPSKCSMIQLCAKASGTSAAGEKFWRMDAEFQSYVDMAKIIGVTCGVGPNQVQMVQIDNCDTNPSKCSMIDLCAKASGTTSSGEKFWRLDAELQEYVHAAKTIGVSCGVQKSATANAQSVTVSKPKMVQKYTNRKALVIGNANYLDQTPLKNPINDAKAVAAKLEQVGFEVTYKEDLGVREFGRTLSAYERSLSGSDMSLFYYAGHGIEIDKQNYLIPVDAEITAPEDARYETVVLDDAISASLNTGKLSMILIDACRDNPFSGKMSGGTRSVGRGLSIVDVGKGNVNQIISFAASSGEVAEDGSGQNSPYASAIIDLLDEPNLEIGKLFRLVRDRVTQATGGKQKPVVNQDLSGEDIFLVVE